ncbi:hypothetical protein [Acanthopleuribacter pedis]|uniref:Uncharacterized protein n=1 Tax=Acanthopleuribacter pedis TaxID=442870 RepID=A0A8J7QBG0_9BACT|nr:hypothetical protein [Acanthopleuribacter pedis]MBO1321024.1 hypothetical protein [Acanthopleuribacter pedis]
MPCSSIPTPISTPPNRDRVHAICMYCQAARVNKTTWLPLQEGEKPLPRVSHGVCPSCYDQAVKQLVLEIRGLSA